MPEADSTSAPAAPADMPKDLPDFVPPKAGEFDTATPDELKSQFAPSDEDKARQSATLAAFDKQVGLGTQFADEPPRATAASRMKAKVRDVLDAQPFHAEHVHKSDLLAVIDALIDGPDNDGPGY